MASFATHRAKVHDRDLPLHRRHSALRTCIALFAPYGFRATYHHLTVSARIPRHLEADPDALVRAVEELHQARTIWLAAAVRYAAQRREQKARGVRGPLPWKSGPTNPAGLFLRTNNPLDHPSLSLPEFVARQVSLAEGHTGGHPDPAADRPEAGPPVQLSLWKEVLERRHMLDSGEPNPAWATARQGWATVTDGRVRQIVVDGVDYQWHIVTAPPAEWSASGPNSRLGFTVWQGASARLGTLGTRLIADTGSTPPCGWCPVCPPGLAVTPKLVEAAVRRALRQGWQPEAGSGARPGARSGAQPEAPSGAQPAPYHVTIGD